jgi:hypothetical protein
LWILSITGTLYKCGKPDFSIENNTSPICIHVARTPDRPPWASFLFGIFFLCELSASFFWRVFCAWGFGGFFCLRQNGNWRQTPWQKLVPFTPGNSSRSDTGQAANKEDLRKFQLENVEREHGMIYLNIILFLLYLIWPEIKTLKLCDYFCIALIYEVTDHCA